MHIEIDLDTATMEELNHFKSIIELKIREIELAQERQKDKDMLRTYRNCLIGNVYSLRSCNPRINDEKVGLKSLIKDFVKSDDKQLCLKENFVRILTYLTMEIYSQYQHRSNTLLDRKETQFLLGEFLRELDKIEVE